MLIYNYDEITKEYTNSCNADLDPEETKQQGKNVYLIPANATIKKPPKTQQYEAAVYNNGWGIVVDYRGLYMVNSDMRPQKVEQLGSLPEGYAPATEQQAQKILEDDVFYIVQDGQLIENPDYTEQKLAEVKAQKYDEALTKAKDFIDNEAAYRFDENNTIEATDGNIGKLTAYALGFSTGTLTEVYWTSKEDNVLELNQEDLLAILTGLGAIQSNVWNVQYITYKQSIDNAQTVEEVEEIEVVYVN